MACAASGSLGFAWALDLWRCFYPDRLHPIARLNPFNYGTSSSHSSGSHSCDAPMSTVARPSSLQSTARSILWLRRHQWPMTLPTPQLSLVLRLMIPTRTRREWKPEQVSNQPDNIQNTENIKIGDNLIGGWPPRDSSSQLVTRRSFYGTSSRRHLWWIWWWRVICVCRVGGWGWWEGWFTLGGTALPHGATASDTAVMGLPLQGKRTICSRLCCSDLYRQKWPCR